MKQQDGNLVAITLVQQKQEQLSASKGILRIGLFKRAPLQLYLQVREKSDCLHSNDAEFQVLHVRNRLQPLLTRSGN